MLYRKNFRIFGVLLLTSLFAQSALAQIVVTPSDNQGWVIAPDVPGDVPVVFSDGPATTGTGALEFGPIGADPAAKFIMFPPLADIPTQDFGLFGIDFYPIAGNPNDFYLNLYVDQIDNGLGTFTNGFYDCRYDLVPGGALNTWSPLVILSGSAANLTVTGNQTCPATVSGMTDDSLVRFIAVNGGQSVGTDTGLTGRFDSAVATIGNTATDWDFEADAVPVGPGAAVAIPAGSSWSMLLLLLALSGVAALRLRGNA